MIRICWILIAFTVIPGSTRTATTLNRCFERITRRTIDNYPPLAEYQMETLRACADYCIMAAGNERKKEPLCRSFTYNIALKICHLYDHDGMKVPAILYPAIGIDFYKRIDKDEICRGTFPFKNNNANFAVIGSPTSAQENANEELESLGEIETFSSRIRNQDIPNERAITIDGDLKVLQKKPTKEFGKISKNTKDVAESEQCFTSNAYYVVIGDEIVRPMNNEGTVKVYNNVDQGDCANFCSNNQGPNKEDLVCNSLNYFPLTRKCELYSILAEPHGPGTLVENQDVIYAEKFCLPESTQRCQNDEIFILHVQKSLSRIPIQQTPSGSITSCLQACLNVYACKTAVFNSIKEHCELYSEKVTKSQESIVDTPPGFVMIENGCDGNGGGSVRGRPVQNHKTIISEEMKSLQKLPPVYLNTEDSSSEWSDCDFYVKGVRVKARTIGGQMETRAC